jgi:hypothetical protein
MLLAIALAPPALAQWNWRPGWRPPPALDPSSAARTLQTAVDWRQREQAAQRLGDSGDLRWVTVLAGAAANDPNVRVRRAASDAIASIRQANGRPGNNVRPPWPGVPGWGGGWRPDDGYADMIDSWFQRYLGRSVDRGGLASRLTLLREGADPLDIEADIIGSDEYWNRNGRNVTGFIRGLYRDVLNRQPDARELRGWVSRFDANRRNRSAVAREFLQAAQLELSGRRWS